MGSTHNQVACRTTNSHLPQCEAMTGVTPTLILWIAAGILTAALLFGTGVAAMCHSLYPNWRNTIRSGLTMSAATTLIAATGAAATYALAYWAATN